MSKFWVFKRPRTYLEYGVAEAQWRDFQAQGDFHPPRAQRHPAAPSTPSTTCPSPQSSRSVGQHARDAVMDQDPQCGRSAPVELGAARQSWHLACHKGARCSAWRSGTPAQHLLCEAAPWRMMGGHRRLAWKPGGESQRTAVLHRLAMSAAQQRQSGQKQTGGGLSTHAHDCAISEACGSTTSPQSHQRCCVWPLR